jgi:acyl transferase domain-containing protein
MAVKIAVARGKALDMVDNIGGAMVAVSGCNADMIRHYVEIASTLVEVENRDLNELYMAAFNSPTDISVSGSEKLIDAFTSFIDRWVDGVVARKLRISTASHSPFVDLCEEQYRSDLVPIFAEFPGPHVPTTLTMSTVTSEFKSDAYTIDYLWKNIRQPVLFSTAIPKIVERFPCSSSRCLPGTAYHIILARWGRSPFPMPSSNCR